MAKVATMDDLFLDEIRDLYDAEKQLTKALPKMAHAASSTELRTALENHLGETQKQVERLEQIFESLDAKATGKKCAGMAGLIREGEAFTADAAGTAVRDAGIIVSAQKVEHYEMAGYGSARAHAQILGHIEAMSLLEQTLKEEQEADLKLNDIAETTVNEQAVNAPLTETGTTSHKSSAPKTRTAGS